MTRNGALNAAFIIREAGFVAPIVSKEKSFTVLAIFDFDKTQEINSIQEARDFVATHKR